MSISSDVSLGSSDVRHMSVEKIQEAIVGRRKILEKLTNIFLVLFFAGFVPFNTVAILAVVKWSNYMSLGLGITYLVCLPFLLGSSLVVIIVILKNGKKQNILAKEVGLLERELLLKSLGGGEILGAPVLSSEWSSVEVRKSGDVKEFMARLSCDDNDVPFVEVKALL